MVRTIFGALIACSAAWSVVCSPAVAVNFNVNPPMRPVYPHTHLNSPLNSHIAPRIDRDIRPVEDCLSVTKRSKEQRKRQCRTNESGTAMDEPVR